METFFGVFFGILAIPVAIYLIWLAAFFLVAAHKVIDGVRNTEVTPAQRARMKAAAERYWN